MRLKWDSWSSNLFTHHGYKIFTAETVDVALEMSDNIPLDAIILDVNLGTDNGLKLMTFLHRNHPEIPIIIYHRPAALMTRW